MSEKRWEPEVGEQAMAYYDGKFGRGVPCEILEVEDDNRIKVRHKDWGEPERGMFEHWATRESPLRFGGYTDDKEGLMARLFGFPGDWYAILRKEE